MGESILSFLHKIHWANDFHWYLSHLNIIPVISDYQHGHSFTHDEWISIVLVGINLVVLIALAHFLIKVRKNAAFLAWLGHKRSQLTARSPMESQTKLEPKLTGSPDLQKAYNLHRMAMYDSALNKYKQAFSSSPDDLNIYLVGIQIVSEMDEPNVPFVQFLKEGISNLRIKHPSMWNEVARFGREKAPSLDQWAPA